MSSSRTPGGRARQSGLGTPGRVGAAQGPTQKPTVPMFADGSSAPLRHAPRKKKGTGEKLPAPCTPATIPAHWETVKVGEKPKPKQLNPVSEVPDFEKWRKTRKHDLPQIVEVRPAPSGGAATPMPLQQPGGMTPFLPRVDAPVVKAPENDAMIPLFKQEGDVTPFMGNAGQAIGVASTTASVMHLAPGAETPRVAFTPGSASAQAAAGSSPQEILSPGIASTLGTASASVWAPGAETPRITASTFGEETPRLGGYFGEETPRIAYPVGVTPTAGGQSRTGDKEKLPNEHLQSMAGAMTPQVGLPPLAPPLSGGAETPRLDQSGLSGDATPFLGGMTPALPRSG